MSEQQIIPVDLDANTTVDELLDRAARDLAHTVAARTERETQGGTETRDGILHGEDDH